MGRKLGWGMVGSLLVIAALAGVFIPLKILPALGAAKVASTAQSTSTGKLVTVSTDKVGNVTVQALDPATGAVASIGSATNLGETDGLAQGVSAFDAANHILYFPDYPASGGVAILGFSTQTGKLASDAPLSIGPSFLAFDPASGKLMTVTIDKVGNVTIQALDPATGAIMPAPVTVNLGEAVGLAQGVSAFDATNHILYFPDYPASGGSAILGFSTQTNTQTNMQAGALVSNAPLTIGPSFLAFDGAPPTPQQQLQALTSQVQGLETAGTLSNGAANDLLASLNAATSMLSNTTSGSAGGTSNNSDTIAACNDLAAFVNKVDALVNSGSLTPQQGTTLTDPAKSLMSQLCG